MLLLGAVLCASPVAMLTLKQSIASATAINMTSMYVYIMIIDSLHSSLSTLHFALSPIQIEDKVVGSAPAGGIGGGSVAWNVVGFGV